MQNSLKVSLPQFCLLQNTQLPFQDKSTPNIQLCLANVSQSLCCLYSEDFHAFEASLLPIASRNFCLGTLKILQSVEPQFCSIIISVLYLYVFRPELHGRGFHKTKVQPGLLRNQLMYVDLRTQFLLYGWDVKITSVILIPLTITHFLQPLLWSEIQGLCQNIT